MPLTRRFKVEYHANENPLKNSEKIAYVDERLMYLIIKKLKKLKNLTHKFKKSFIKNIFLKFQISLQNHSF